jgi:hypothetical protein
VTAMWHCLQPVSHHTISFSLAVSETRLSLMYIWLALIFYCQSGDVDVLNPQPFHIKTTS